MAACASWDGSVGAVFARDNPTGRVFVRDAPSDMAGAKAGLLVGDELVSIDGHPVKPMYPADLQKALEGRVGTKVKLQVLRNGGLMNLEVERGPFRDKV
ncbi:MAG: PDZ domain-containing protein [Polyangiaceae bacterium]